MTRKKQRELCVAICLLAAFVLWTALLYIVDVRPIGPLDSQVGFASMNRWVHERTGVSMPLYTVTDWLGLVPILVCFIFAGPEVTHGATSGTGSKTNRYLLKIYGLFRDQFTGLRSQNFSAYSLIERSAAKNPAALVLRSDILVHFSLSSYALSISS